PEWAGGRPAERQRLLIVLLPHPHVPRAVADAPQQEQRLALTVLVAPLLAELLGLFRKEGAPDDLPLFRIDVAEVCDGLDFQRRTPRRAEERERLLEIQRGFGQVAQRPIELADGGIGQAFPDFIPGRLPMADRLLEFGDRLLGLFLPA